MGDRGIVFDAVLVAHVLSAVVAMGSILATGTYASIAGRPGRARSGGVRRYFRPGTNWVPRALYVVPLLGLVLVVLGHEAHRFDQLWLWLSTLLWVVGAILAQGVLWPAERQVQARLAGGAGGSGGAAGAGSLGSISRRVAAAAAGVDLCLLAAFVLMVGRPGAG